MFRNYLMAALRNLARNRVHSGISILGLSIGLCAAILVSLGIRNQLSFEHFIPGYERTYLIASALSPAGRSTLYGHLTHSGIATALTLRFYGIESIARLAGDDVRLSKDQLEADEHLYWADPDIFNVLPLPTIAGDLNAALRRSDGLVLTRSLARKYFGRDNAVGEIIQLSHTHPNRTHPMIVTAVIEDLPVNGTQLETGLFASGLAADSRLTSLDNDPNNSLTSWNFQISVNTYLRLSQNTSVAQLQQAMPALMESAWPRAMRPGGADAAMELVRIDNVQVHPQLSPGRANSLIAWGAVGLLILLIACINFINHVAARSARRALEVGIRKVSGAGQGAITLQFVGESLVYALLAACLAMALTELLLPYMNAFANAGAAFDYWRDPRLLAWIALSVLVVAMSVGAYPAFLLSALRPVNALKGLISYSRGAGALRQALVALQFAILISLMISAAVVYQQRIYATQDALRVEIDQILIIRTSNTASAAMPTISAPCNPAFKTELQMLPGVRGVSCMGMTFLNGDEFSTVRTTDGRTLTFSSIPVDPDAFGVYGLRPVAGRLFSATDTGTSTPAEPPTDAIARCVINETAVRQLGFTSHESAIGKIVAADDSRSAKYQVIGVIPDYLLDSVEQRVKPSLYYVASRMPSPIVSIKLTGRDMPETLSAIDRLWAATGASEPIRRFFLNDYIQDLYIVVLREGQALGIFSLVAVLLACLGLIGLATSTAELRTKEIGVRKAMGATRADIVVLLLWEFSKPVLWANLLAWPVAAVVMNHWLQGFAYHIDLKPWLFVAATALTVMIALLTVSVHSVLMARARPVTALRYE